MRVDADDLLVTTGGQQVIDLVCKTLLDPGDVVIAEAPTYPGAVPTLLLLPGRRRADRDGRRRHAHRRARGRARRASTPRAACRSSSTRSRRFQNPAGRDACRSSAGGGSSRSRASASCWCSRTTRTACCASRASRCRRCARSTAATTSSTSGTFSKILSAGLRLGWAAAPRPVLAKMNLGKQGADLCSSSLTQHFVAGYFADGDWRRYVDDLIGLYRRRRDVMLEALAEHLPAEATWTRPQGGLFVWATLPDYIDTTDLLARGAARERRLRARPRRVPRRPRRLVDAPELLRRRRGRDPRGRAPHRQGRRRSRSACTRRSPAGPAAPPRGDGGRAAADVVELRRRSA